MAKEAAKKLLLKIFHRLEITGSILLFCRSLLKMCGWLSPHYLRKVFSSGGITKVFIACYFKDENNAH